MKKIVCQVISGVILVFITLMNSTVSAENFSCRIGSTGACLGYGDTICSSQGMCVNSDSICYNKNTCGYGYDNGMVCKKDYNELVEEYNDLFGSYKKLSSSCDNTISEYNSLLSKYNGLVNEFNDMRELAIERGESLENREYCVQNAQSLEEAKGCSLYY